MPLLRTHPLHTAHAGTSAKVQQECLDVVVGMVGHADILAFFLHQQFFKPSIAQFAGCHLNANATLPRHLLGLETPNVQGNTPTKAKLPHKLLVAVGIVATKTEVAVCSHYVTLFLKQHQQQRHGVRAAAKCHKKSARRKLHGEGKVTRL